MELECQHEYVRTDRYAEIEITKEFQLSSARRVGNWTKFQDNYIFLRVDQLPHTSSFWIGHVLLC
jgi:hypothetical protein